ncbi:type-F conjugative transfer system pilin assembly protein TrbC [Candidatus Parcubacteria bacterium]|nr:MAG: type-F conjugative transfer system pilin assembly protein TrbC [Candidatus Parcubacteria bacterium]
MMKSFMRLVGPALMLSVCVSAFADTVGVVNDQDISQARQSALDAFAKLPPSFQGKGVAMPKTGIGSYSVPDTPGYKAGGADLNEMIKDFQKEKKRGAAKRDRQDGVYIFLSQSVPAGAIRAYEKDAKRIRGNLVLRGFTHERSIGATKAKIMEWNRGINARGWMVDPVMFKALQITQVPAIALVHFKDDLASACVDDAQVCGNGTLDAAVVYGDVSVSHALKRIASSSKTPQLREMAREYLVRLGDTLEYRHSTTGDPNNGVQGISIR